MKQYQVTSKQQTGVNTTALLLSPIEEDTFPYEAGQYVAVGFRRGWQRTPMRCFSATTAPNEHGDIGIAFRSAGKFTRAFSALEVGSKVDVRGPFGDFTVSPEERRPLVFLAGGIGITPFLSLLQDVAARRAAQPVTVLYSVRTLDDVPFARELMKLHNDVQHITVRFLTDDVSPQAQAHPMVLQSKLNADVLAKVHTVDTQYYICGPAGYAALCNRLLKDMGVSSSAVHNEAFSQASTMNVAGFALQKVVFGLFATAIMAGAGLFMLKDVVKQHEQNEAAASQQTTQSATEDDSTEYSADDDYGASETYTDSGSSSSSSSTAPTTTTPSTTYTAPSQPTYQSPSSSVS